MAETITPSTFAEVAEALVAAATSPYPIRVTGAATKLGWGGAVGRQPARLQMRALSRMVDHDSDAMTATLEAGMPVARAQRQLAQSGQTLALDPPGIEAGDRGPTVGGTFATADAGPLQHRYGGPCDLVLGARVALSDGAILALDRELAQLFTGAFGSLGVLLSLTVRLHPVAGGTLTALGASEDAVRLCEAATRLNAAGLDLEALDLAWRRGRGGILAQVAGENAGERAAAAATILTDCGLRDVATRDDDERLWARERAGQRSIDRAVVRVTDDPDRLRMLVGIADGFGATVVSRAALGVSYLTLNVNQIVPLREALPSGASAVVLDVPVAARGVVSVWGEQDTTRVSIMRAVKQQFDPAGVCNPGIFIGGI